MTPAPAAPARGSRRGDDTRQASPRPQPAVVFEFSAAPSSGIANTASDSVTSANSRVSGALAQSKFFKSYVLAAAMPYLLSQLLFFARWAGTLLVLAAHAATQFVNFNDAAGALDTPFIEAWRFIVSFELGRHAVIGFFVMSGFLVGGAAFKHLREERPFLFEYFIHRVARIYLVLLPAILLTLAFDTAGRALFAGVGIYEFPFLQEHYNPLLIFADLLNVQGIIAPYYGTNGPLWSVGYEFWYYFLFPALLLPMSRAYPRRLAWMLSIAALIVIVAITARQGWFLLGFVVWCMGAAAIVPRRPLIRSAAASLLLDIIIVLTLRTLVSGEALVQYPRLLHVSDIISAAAFANLILTLRFSAARTWPLLESDLHRQLANFSFSLYAIHMPLLVFIRSGAAAIFGESWLIQPAEAKQWLALSGAMSAAIGAGYVFSLLTEAHTSEIRRRLRRFLCRATPESAVAELSARRPEKLSTPRLSAKLELRFASQRSKRPPAPFRERVREDG